MSIGDFLSGSHISESGNQTLIEAPGALLGRDGAPSRWPSVLVLLAFAVIAALVFAWLASHGYIPD